MVGLEAFAEDIWTVDGPTVRDFGFRFTTRMTIVKLADGAVWISSPVLVPFETVRAIADLGPVRYLVAATPRHVWRLEAWHALFPHAELWAAPTTLFTLSKGDLPPTGTLGDAPHAGWANDLDQLSFKGSPLIQESIFFHKKSRTVILDDLVQMHHKTRGTPIRTFLLDAEGVGSPHGGVGREIRWTFTNRRLARQSLAKLLCWDFDKVIIAHGPCIQKNAKPFVERAFRWLGR